MPSKKLLALLAVLVLAGGAWYGYAHFRATPIGKLVATPRDFEGKVTTISGRVTERTSLVLVKYFILKDDTGEIPVVTKRTLPEVGAKLRIQGRVGSVALGPAQTTVFLERQPDVR